MSHTYDSTLPDERDHVRFLIRDVASPWIFEDEEIDATLDAQMSTGTARRYYAAAEILSLLAMSMATTRGDIGVREKRLADLQIKWGVDEDTLDAINARISLFRKIGGNHQARSMKVFRVMPRGTRYVD